MSIAQVGCRGFDLKLSFFPQWGSLTSATTAAGATSSAVRWKSTRNAATTICRTSAWRLPGRSWVTTVGGNRVLRSLGLGASLAFFFFHLFFFLPLRFASLPSYRLLALGYARGKKMGWNPHPDLTAIFCWLFVVALKSVFHFFSCTNMQTFKWSKSPVQSYCKN